MRALVQRVKWASVCVDGQEVSRIGIGLVVFLGIGRGDTVEDARYLCDKTVGLRILADAEGRFNHSALDIGVEMLIVSQFTLYADIRKGRRPSFVNAAPPDQAQEMFEVAVEMFRDTNLQVQVGRFQEYMEVEVCNDGPVSIWLDSLERYRSRRRETNSAI